MADLDELTQQLERLADALRAGNLDAEAAAELVEECARVAAEAAGELERQARAETRPGQTELL